MRLNDPRAIDGIKRDEEKAQRIKGYISDYVMSLAAADLPAEAKRDVCILARSVESPVLISALALSNELAAVGAAVFAVIGAPGPDEEDLEALRAKAKAPFDLTLRLARHPRLSDAHEQLVLGEVSTWYGDSLRRDPMKRDAFDCFSGGDAVKASRARLAFGRLWQVAVPLGLGTIVRGDAPIVQPDPRLPGRPLLERQ